MRDPLFVSDPARVWTSGEDDQVAECVFGPAFGRGHRLWQEFEGFDVRRALSGVGWGNDGFVAAWGGQESSCDAENTRLVTTIMLWCSRRSIPTPGCSPRGSTTLGGTRSSIASGGTRDAVSYSTG